MIWNGKSLGSVGTRDVYNVECLYCIEHILYFLTLFFSQVQCICIEISDFWISDTFSHPIFTEERSLGFYVFVLKGNKDDLVCPAPFLYYTVNLHCTLSLLYYICPMLRAERLRPNVTCFTESAFKFFLIYGKPSRING